MNEHAESRQVFDSPLGPLTLVAAAGALRAVLFAASGSRPGAAPRPGAAATEPPPPEASAIPGSPPAADAAVLAETACQLERYFGGEPHAFELPLDLAGTAFQRRVWAELRTIPHGETVSYGELARRIGSPGEAREVGAAVGRTPTPVVVPCHRVIGADGALVGYGGGLERKRALLDLERGVLPLLPAGSQEAWLPTATKVPTGTQAPTRT